MQAGDGFRQPFVVAGEPAESGHPAEAPFHSSPARQQDEAALSLGVRGDFEADAVGRGVSGRLSAGVPLIDEGERDGLAGDLLDGLGERGNLDPILLVGRRDVQGEQVAERVDPRATFDAIIFRVRTGCQWNWFPKEYPDDSSVSTRQRFEGYRPRGDGI